MLKSPTMPVPSRSALVVALLSLAVVVTALLSWEAVAGAKRARETAESVLRDYAALAADQFVREAESGLDSQIALAIDSVRHASNRAESPSRRRAPGTESCQCAPPPTAVTLFVLSPLEILFERGTPLDPALANSIRTDLGNPSNRRPKLRVIDGGAVITQVEGFGSDSVLMGFIAGPAFVTDIFKKVVDESVLLPSTLAARAAVRHALTVRVVDSGGRQVFSVRDLDSPYQGGGAFAPRFGGLRAEVVIPSSLASSLVIGGLPAARWPLAIGLLLLAVGLAIAAVIQLRREIRFARARADFVSSVSHELRTPLAQIRLFGETLQLGRVRSRDEERHAADVIVQESQRLSQMVDNVLVFSRTTRAHGTLRREPVALAALLTDIVESFRPQAASKGVTVRFESHDLHGTGLVDRDAVRHIVLNLLDNAVKYGPRGQTVTVEAAAADAKLHIAVADEGPGIPTAQRPRLWEPFWRGSGSAEGGTGLGLAIVRELVTAHGGTVSVEDRPGGGARFVVALAAADSADTDLVPADAARLPV